MLRGAKLREYLDGLLAKAGVRTDAAGDTTTFARQLEFIMAETFKIEFLDLKAQILFPVSSEVPDWAESFTYRQYTRTGRAKIVNNYAKDFPAVELKGAEFPAPIRSLGDSYNYSLQDLRRAQAMNISVDAEKASAAKQGIDESIEDISFTGDAATGIKGLFSATSQIPSVTKPTATKWDDPAVTPDQMVADLDALSGATFSGTKGKFPCDTLLLGTTAFRALTTKRASVTFRDDTVMSFILKTSPWIKNIAHWARLDGAGAGGKDRIMVYKRDPACIRLVLPKAFEQLPPVLENMAFSVACHARIGGFMVRHPLAAAYMDGVLT